MAIATLTGLGAMELVGVGSRPIWPLRWEGRIQGRLGNDAEEEEGYEDHGEGADGEEEEKVGGVVGEGKVSDTREEECAQPKGGEGESSRRPSVMGPIQGGGLERGREGRTAPCMT